MIRSKRGLPLSEVKVGSIRSHAGVIHLADDLDRGAGHRLLLLIVADRHLDDKRLLEHRTFGNRA